MARTCIRSLTTSIGVYARLPSICAIVPHSNFLDGPKLSGTIFLPSSYPPKYSASPFKCNLDYVLKFEFTGDGTNSDSSKTSIETFNTMI